MKTKKEITEYVRELIGKYKVGSKLGHTDFDFIMELLKNHPEYDKKVDGGVVGIFVEMDTTRKATKHFVLERVDGSKTDFSWVKCINKPNNRNWDNFQRACRESIKNQIIQFKQELIVDGKIKTIKGELLNPKDVHIDHKYPFVNLVKEFIKDFSINVDNVKYIEGDNVKKKEFIDKQLEFNFQQYHSQHAWLEVLSIKDNLSKGSKYK